MLEVVPFSCEWVTTVLNQAGCLLFYHPSEGIESREIRKVVYDTRRLLQKEEDAIFLALRGRQDGHRFISEAFQKGVRYFLVEHLPSEHSGATFWVVKDTLQALHAIARAKRQQMEGLVIAITGSNGKTIVKEWLYWILSRVGKQVYRAPRSFNSQLGVPLSLLQCPPDVEIAIFEAGISRQGEMKSLSDLLKPNLGIFTMLGTAHDEGFQSREQKLKEKLSLFETASHVIVQEKGGLKLLGEKAVVVEEKYRLKVEQQDEVILIQQDGKTWKIPSPLRAPWVAFNLSLVIGACLYLGVPMEEIVASLPDLPHVEMRMQVLMPHGNLWVINDTYNADFESFYHAFHYLVTQTHSPHTLVFTSLEEVGGQDRALHERIFTLISSHLEPSRVHYIGERWLDEARKYGFHVYSSVDDLLREVPYPFFQNLEGTILLKGARKYRLERLLPYLGNVHPYPRLEVDLEAMMNNLQRIHEIFPFGTKILLLLKAAAYGTGAWQIASFFESNEMIKLYGVAHVHEGVLLRKQGIKKPILVFIPGPIDPYFTFHLTPSVSSLAFLQALELEGRERKQTIPVHLEWDTGMSRLGFLPEQVEEVIAFCQSCQYVQVEGIFSHLTSADEAEEDEWTLHQIRIFRKIEEQFRENGFPHIVAHIQNSAGALRFPHEHFDMIRIGIGAYTPFTTASSFQEVVSLKAEIIRVQAYPRGGSVGYNRRFQSGRFLRVATINIGYADGVPYHLSNRGYQVVIRGRPAPLIGSICMDMCMADVTHIPEAKEGDEVLIFGKNEDVVLPLFKMAQMAGTIPYEILSKISSRVARFYIKP
jgi:alanine racemase